MIVLLQQDRVTGDAIVVIITRTMATLERHKLLGRSIITIPATFIRVGCFGCLYGCDVDGSTCLLGRLSPRPEPSVLVASWRHLRRDFACCDLIGVGREGRGREMALGGDHGVRLVDVADDHTLVRRTALAAAIAMVAVCAVCAAGTLNAVNRTGATIRASSMIRIRAIRTDDMTVRRRGMTVTTLTVTIAMRSMSETVRRRRVNWMVPVVMR